MKIRDGFVSNSSSSSFIILLIDETRHLANYNYQVVEREYVSKSQKRTEKCIWDEAKGDFIFVDKRKWLQKNGWRKTDEPNDYFNIWEKVRPIHNTLEMDSGRSTSICLGKDLLQLAQDYKDSDIGEALKKAIQEHGVENIMFIMWSDEGMGGDLPEELVKLTNKPLFATEYH